MLRTICTKEWKMHDSRVTVQVLIATPCTKSLRCESGGHKHGGDEGRRLCWKCAAVSWSGAGGAAAVSWRQVTKNLMYLIQ